ncbi:MAG TPA: tetratricopeptide repeat protein [Candidatus Polarisedimenticolaceae bacterium]|nr:tetratricopeptide repeat protein [Candidatus Polarisedimenticolaceae bacterium]
MKKENLAFLVGGLAFGFLVGFGAYHAVATTPQLEGAAAGTTMAGPAGTPAPGAMPPAAVGAAPMVAEINRLKTLLQTEPNNFQALVRLGNLHYDVQMWEQAAGYYERALAVESNPDLMTDLGVCYRNLGQFDRALDKFENAQQADPDHFQSLFNIVVVAGLDLGDFVRAERALEVLEAMDPPPPRIDELRHAVEQSRASRADAGGES